MIFNLETCINIFKNLYYKSKRSIVYVKMYTYTLVCLKMSVQETQNFSGL